jgi:hypothetical protein
MLADKLYVDFLCERIVWRNCKKNGDKELERGCKRSNVLGKIGRKKKLSTIVLENHVLNNV